MREKDSLERVLKFTIGKNLKETEYNFIIIFKLYFASRSATVVKAKSKKKKEFLKFPDLRGNPIQHRIDR